MKLLRLMPVAAIVVGFLAFLIPSSETWARGPESVADIARDVSDAVVNIGTSRRMLGGSGMPFPEAPDGSPLGDLFDGLNPNQGQGEDQMDEARSLGSGFIISSDGLIVTNNHVIEGADEVLVYLTDGTRHEATIVGADEKTDLAVLRINAGRTLKFVPFGDSDAADVGDWVMAIGNPFGLGGSVTLGIVSARNRNINSGPYDNFIQTDAAINQGNSGGPLIDMDGNVVGINTAIISRTGGGLGIGFAVPINLARNVIAQLSEFGETRRGWLGVGIQEVSLDMALSLGRDNTNGALVVDVTEEGPSDGVLLDGDLILDFNGQPIVTMRDLPRIVAETPVGQGSAVHVLRNGVELDFDVILGRLEDSERVALADVMDQPFPEVGPPMPPVSALNLLDLVGLEVRNLDADNRAEFGIDAAVRGVLVASVAHGSDAADKGIVKGMIIQEVNQKPVDESTEISALVGEAREAGRPAVLFKLADATGARRFLAVRLR